MPNKPIEKYVRNREVYTPPPVAEIPTPRTSTSVGNDEALALTKNLLADLKSAYIHSLQEKEEQILQLKVENADLKTLVKILETQKTETPISAPDFDTEIESWS
jgi:hypothetical protein